MTSVEQKAVFCGPIIWMLGAFLVITGWAKQLDIVRCVRATSRYRHHVINVIASFSKRDATRRASVLLFGLQPNNIIGAVINGASGDSGIPSRSGSADLFRIGRLPLLGVSTPMLSVRSAVFLGVCCLALFIFGVMRLALRLQFISVFAMIFGVAFLNFLRIGESVLFVLLAEPLFVFGVPFLIPLAIVFGISNAGLGFAAFVVSPFVGYAATFCDLLLVLFSRFGLNFFKSFRVGAAPPKVSLIGFRALLFRSHKYMISNNLITVEA